MAVPSKIVVPWPGTVAAIPAGWTRNAAIDNKYVQCAPVGQDADTATARGNATHTHTSPSHGTTEDSHAHTVEALGSSGATTYNSVLLLSFATDGHTHDPLQSEGTVSTSQGVGITVNATADNDPLYRKVIWLESDGSPTGLPASCYAFFIGDTLPTNWTRQEGNNFLKGAAAGADGTGVGGSATHTHTSPAHTHTADSHVHTGTSESNFSAVLGGSGAGNGAAGGHAHTYDLDPTTPTSNSVTTTINSGDGQPTFKKINIVRNDTLGQSLPVGIIAFYNGTNASIPSKWTRYSNMDGYFAKGAAANGESGVVTGGSATHSHTATDCQPTGISHTHTLTQSGGDAQIQKGTGAGTIASTAHTHTWTIAGDTITFQPTAVTIDASSSEASWPQYVRLIPVQFTNTIGTTRQFAGYLGRRLRWGSVQSQGM